MTLLGVEIVKKKKKNLSMIQMRQRMEGEQATNICKSNTETCMTLIYRSRDWKGKILIMHQAGIGRL